MASMATLSQKIAAERQARSLLEREDLPPPDRVEYGYTCIWLLWEEQKVSLQVQIEGPSPGCSWEEAV
jgi:hypothetical protein